MKHKPEWIENAWVWRLVGTSVYFTEIPKSISPEDLEAGLKLIEEDDLKPF